MRTQNKKRRFDCVTWQRSGVWIASTIGLDWNVSIGRDSDEAIRLLKDRVCRKRAKRSRSPRAFVDAYRRSVLMVSDTLDPNKSHRFHVVVRLDDDGYDVEMMENQQ